jgi:hypothetical protein
MKECLLGTKNSLASCNVCNLPTSKNYRYRLEDKRYHLVFNVIQNFRFNIIYRSKLELHTQDLEPSVRVKHHRVKDTHSGSRRLKR